MGVTDSTGNEVAVSVHYPNDNLVRAIVKAWTENSFRDALLTYPDLHTEQDWQKRAQPDYARTGNALKQIDASYDCPIVLTQAQYEWGYQKARDQEVIFVLPDQPAVLDARNSFDAAKHAMENVVFGM